MAGTAQGVQMTKPTPESVFERLSEIRQRYQADRELADDVVLRHARRQPVYQHELDALMQASERLRADYRKVGTELGISEVIEEVLAAQEGDLDLSRLEITPDGQHRSQEWE